MSSRRQHDRIEVETEVNFPSLWLDAFCQTGTKLVKEVHCEYPLTLAAALVGWLVVGCMSHGQEVWVTMAHELQIHAL